MRAATLAPSFWNCIYPSGHAVSHQHLPSGGLGSILEP
jgi:hypothetical protein